jgi:HSP20 family protein
MPLPVVRRQRNQRPNAQLATSQPWRDLDDLRDQLMQAMWPSALIDPDLAFVPAVDVEETEDAWIVEAELPGVSEKDVTVELHDTELVISGEIKERERHGVLRRRERRVGRFEYRVELPYVGDGDNVDATLDHGVLTVRVPKPEAAQRRQVEIRST